MNFDFIRDREREDPYPDGWLNAMLAVFMIATILVLLAGCGSSGRRPPRPPVPPIPPAESYVVDLSDEGAGRVSVVSTNCGPLDRARVESELRTAARRIQRDTGAPAACLDGLRLQFVAGAPNCPFAAPGVKTGCAVPWEGYVEVECGAYGAVEHEPGHHCAWALGDGDWQRTWHPELGNPPIRPRPTPRAASLMGDDSSEPPEVSTDPAEAQETLTEKPPRRRILGAVWCATAEGAPDPDRESAEPDGIGCDAGLGAELVGKSFEQGRVSWVAVGGSKSLGTAISWAWMEGARPVAIALGFIAPYDSHGIYTGAMELAAFATMGLFGGGER